MTPIFCCGFECGVQSRHWALFNTASFSTSTVRSGARAARSNPTAGSGYFQQNTIDIGSTSHSVFRVYLRFATLPIADCGIVGLDGSLGAVFKVSDGKIYAGKGLAPIAFGSTGVSVATGVWYRLDIYLNSSANPWTADVRVDGVSCGQYTTATAASPHSPALILGTTSGTHTYDAFFDDAIYSQTAADFPIGPGYVHHFVPTADGTHNVASSADFKRGAAGIDITNATTDSYLLVDEVPMDDETPDTNDYINAIAPPNATDYVENIFGPAPGMFTPSAGPRAVEVIVAYHQAGTGSGSSQFRLNDNGTEDTIVALSGAGVTTTRYSRKHYGTMVGGGAWTAARFNNLRHRFGFVGDANPDQYFDCAMIEAEFEDRFGKQTALNQSVKRSSHW